MLDAYRLIRPLLFALDAEFTHDLTLHGLGALGSLLPDWPARVNAPRRVMGIEFPNAVGLAAGLDKDGIALHGLAKLGFGFVEVGTVTPRPQLGNPTPRMFRLPQHMALINRMGFNNLGVDALAARLARRPYPGVLGINIGKNKDTPAALAADDYCYGVRKLYRYASYITVNLSSPNTPGLRDLQLGQALDSLLDALADEAARCRLQTSRDVPMLVKLAPDLAGEDVDAIVTSLVDRGVAGVIVSNTTVSRAGVEGHRCAGEAGGLSGAPLRPLANATLARVAAAARGRLALVGVGGITDAGTAVEKQTLGADLVQLYTGLIYRGPQLVNEVAAALAKPVAG